MEDNVINQEIARAVLESGGHRVDVVPDGREAVSAVQSADYDLLLMDIQMPVMDGIAATRAIRALDHPSRTVPIIAMTASVQPHQVSSYFSAGMNGHVAKPFKRDELLAAVDRWAIQSWSEVSPPEKVPPRIDRQAFESILSLLGPEKTDTLLERLAQQLREFETVEQDAGDRQEIARKAHAMISAAGLLGLTHLSGICRAIEDRCLAEGDITAPLARLAEARPAALDEIDAIRAEARHSPGR